MSEINVDEKNIQKTEIISKQADNYNNIKKDRIIRFPILDHVEDRSTSDRIEKVVLQGTAEDVINPHKIPYIMRTGARAGCDASLLLEVSDEGTAHAAVTHWEPTDREREAHTNTISRLQDQPEKGKRMAVLVSATIKDPREAEETELYRKMTEWNNGKKPDFIYIPFEGEGIEWDKIAATKLYQLVFVARNDGEGPKFMVSVPGTHYQKEFTAQTLTETMAHDPTFIKYEKIPSSTSVTE